MKIFSKMILGFTLSLGSTFIQAQDVDSIWLQMAHCSGKIESKDMEVDLSIKPATGSILMSFWSGNEPKFTFTTKTIEDSLARIRLEPESDVKYAFQFESFIFTRNELHVKTTANSYLLKCELLKLF